MKYCLLILIGYAVLYAVPSEMKGFVIIWNVITVVSMIMGRIIFTIMSKKHV